MCMACFKNRNKGGVAYGLLLCAICITGALQLRNAYANRLNNRACRTAHTEKAIGCLQRAIRLNKANPLYYANLGLLYARQDSLISLESLVKGKTIRSKEIEKAVECFKQAESLKKNDHLFYLNLSLLYALNGDTTSSLYYLRRSSNTLTNEWDYLLSAILYQKTGNNLITKEQYIQALQHSSNLVTSPLWCQLLTHTEFSSQELVKETEKRLYDNYRYTKSPITAAKLAKLLYEQGYKLQAESLFYKSSLSLPNLNRVWLYRGKIAEEQQDTSQALTFYQRAILLDKTDIIPRLCLSRFQNNRSSIPAIDTILRYTCSEKNKIYQVLFSAELLPCETVIKNPLDFFLQQELTFAKDNTNGGTEKPE